MILLFVNIFLSYICFLRTTIHTTMSDTLRNLYDIHATPHNDRDQAIAAGLPVPTPPVRMPDSGVLGECAFSQIKHCGQTSGRYRKFYDAMVKDYEERKVNIRRLNEALELFGAEDKGKALLCQFNIGRLERSCSSLKEVIEAFEADELVRKVIGI
jgi:hypothetical protein